MESQRAASCLDPLLVSSTSKPTRYGTRAMSLPGIRLEVLESENAGGGDGGGGETHVTGLSENAMSTSHQQHHKLSADKAGVDHNINSTVGATHAQQLLEGSEDSGTATNVAASDRMQRNKPVKWSVEEDRRLRDAVSKVCLDLCLDFTLLSRTNSV